MTKHQCRVSLMAGIPVLALAGTILGSRLGTLIVGTVDLDSDKDQELKRMLLCTKTVRSSIFSFHIFIIIPSHFRHKPLI